MTCHQFINIFLHPSFLLPKTYRAYKTATLVSLHRSIARPWLSDLLRLQFSHQAYSRLRRVPRISVSRMGFQIPPQYRGKLEPFEHGDKRTDDEIFRSLLAFQPIKSEKNIWTFWDSGIERMPAWCRRNVISWVRICGPEWTVRVLDHNPDSPNYAGKYIAKGLPDTFYDKTMDGTHAGPHSADFLRGACLYEYGGAWVDSSIFLMRNMDDICWNQLEDPTSPLRVAVPVMTDNLLNCFIAARKHDPFIKRWYAKPAHVSYVWHVAHQV